MKDRKPQAGFTLIELLVVVLIIGILASIAIPQYFKVVERARVAEAQAFVSAVKQAQERYLARNGAYATTSANFNKLDISFSGSAPSYGMKYFNATVAGAAACGDSPSFQLTLTRNPVNAAIAPRYGTSYSMIYERCADAIDYGSCTKCKDDFD